MIAVTARQASNFWAKVDKTEGCWLWLGALNHGGYGVYSLHQPGTRTGSQVRAHRFAYEQLVGPIGAGLQIDHICRVRNCVNPGHLEAVSARVNVRRAAEVITHCPHGHPYDAVNTGIRLEPDGTRGARRYCKECTRRKALEYFRRVGRANRTQPKTHCREGHELSGENLIEFRDGRRFCRTCWANGLRRRGGRDEN